MAVRAGVDKGADGRWNFEGDMSRVPGDTAPGGTSAGGITDMRWSDTAGGIETTSGGGVWELKVPFEAFDA